MKLNILKGSTSYILHIFIQDSTSTSGAGLTGLTNTSSGLICYYIRAGASADVSVTLNAITTLGTYNGSATNGAFKEIDSTNMPGVYEFQLPNNALASGANQVIFMLKGAGNMAPVLLEIQLVAYDPNSTSLGLSDVSANVVQWNGSAPNNLISGNVPSNVQAVSSGIIATDVWNALRSSYQTAGSFGLSLQILRDNTATAGTSNTITLDSGASTTTDFYKGCIIEIYSGTGSGQSPRVITGYSIGRIATVKPNWITTPDATSKFIIKDMIMPLVGSDFYSLVTADTFTSGETIQSVAGNITGDVQGKLLGGGSSSLTGIACQVDVEQWKAATVATPNVTGTPKVDVVDWLGATPNALVSSNVPAFVEAVNAGVIAVDVWTYATSSITTTGSVGVYLLTALPARVTKNKALNNFNFVMISSTDHVTPKTGLGTGVTATRSIDGAAFGSCTNAPFEIANGVYGINLSAADLNGNNITLRFTGTGADDRLITIVTQTSV